MSVCDCAYIGGVSVLKGDCHYLHFRRKGLCACFCESIEGSTLCGSCIHTATLPIQLEMFSTYSPFSTSYTKGNMSVPWTCVCVRIGAEVDPLSTGTGPEGTACRGPRAGGLCRRLIRTLTALLGRILRHQTDLLFGLKIILISLFPLYFPPCVSKYNTTL